MIDACRLSTVIINYCLQNYQNNRVIEFCLYLWEEHSTFVEIIHVSRNLSTPILNDVFKQKNNSETNM